MTCMQVQSSTSPSDGSLSQNWARYSSRNSLFSFCWHLIFNDFLAFSKTSDKWKWDNLSSAWVAGQNDFIWWIFEMKTFSINEAWNFFLPKHRFIFLTDTGPFAQECPSGADVVFPIQEITLKGLGDPIITCDRWDCFHPPPFTIEPSGAQSLLRSSDWSQTFRPLLKRWPVGNVWCWSSWKYNYRYRL